MKLFNPKTSLSLASMVVLAGALAGAPLVASAQIASPAGSTTAAQPASEGGSATPDVVVPDTSITGSTNPTIDAKRALDAINSTREASNQLGNIAAVAKVNVVRLRDVPGADGAEVTAAVEANKDNTTGVQAAIMANPALSAKLKEEMIDISSVIATHVEADGSLTLWVQ